MTDKNYSEEEILKKHISLMEDGEETLRRFEEWRQCGFAKAVFAAMQECAQQAKSPVAADEEKLTEHEWLDRLTEELAEHGIDASEWEYKYGDNCYTAAEYIAACIKGYAAEREEAAQAQSPVALPSNSLWIYEQDLPPLTAEEYTAWHKLSKVIDGIRMGPNPDLMTHCDWSEAMDEAQQVQSPVALPETVSYTKEEIESFTPEETAAWNTMQQYSPSGSDVVGNRTWLTYREDAVLEMLCQHKPQPRRHKMTDKEIIEKAEAFADSKERRGCAYWSGLKHGYIAAMEEAEQVQSPAAESLQWAVDEINKLRSIEEIDRKCGSNVLYNIQAAIKAAQVQSPAAYPTLKGMLEKYKRYAEINESPKKECYELIVRDLEALQAAQVQSPVADALRLIRLAQRKIEWIISNTPTGEERDELIAINSQLANYLNHTK